MSEAIRRTSDVLRLGASRQVSDYEQRFSSLKNLYEGLLSNLVRMKFDCKEAWETAKEFFGVSSVRFAGIDGTMYSRPLFDLMIFFGGAYASTGTITFWRRISSELSMMKGLFNKARVCQVLCQFTSTRFQI